MTRPVDDYAKGDVWSIEVATSSGVAYSVGDAIGSYYQIADFDNMKSSAFEIKWANVVDSDMQSANLDLIFLSQSLASTTLTDNLPFSLTNSDADRVNDIAHVTDHNNYGLSGISRSGPLDITVRLRSIGDVLGVVPIAKNPRTHTGTAQLLLKLGIVQLDQ